MMYRIAFCVLALALAFPPLVSAQSSTTTVITTEEPGTTAVELQRGPGGRDAAIVVLRSRVDEVSWDGEPLEGIRNWLLEQGSINVILNETALAVEGVTVESEIDLHMQNAQVADILNEVMDQLSERGAVRYRAFGNTIRVSTQQDFEKRLYVRVYDVTDILSRIPDFTDAPEVDLERTQTTGGGGSGGGQTVFSGQGSGGGDDEEDDQETQQRLDELRKLIEDSIEPDTWQEQGGKGTVRTYNKMLVVRNSIEVHEQIGGGFSFGG